MKIDLSCLLFVRNKNKYTIKMNTGLTVTCISANKTHSTFVNFAKFGNKYWTDCAGNKSKPGYYFVFVNGKYEVIMYKIHNMKCLCILCKI